MFSTDELTEPTVLATVLVTGCGLHRAGHGLDAAADVARGLAGAATARPGAGGGVVVWPVGVITTRCPGCGAAGVLDIVIRLGADRAGSGLGSVDDDRPRRGVAADLGPAAKGDESTREHE